MFVQWEGDNPTDSTWVPKSTFVEAYPTLDLQDKIISGECGNDTVWVDPILSDA